jgi:hypothetical protein
VLRLQAAGGLLGCYAVYVDRRLLRFRGSITFEYGIDRGVPTRR